MSTQAATLPTADDAMPNKAERYVVYCLTSPSGDDSYVGVTNDLVWRLRQHRGEVMGGAAATGRRYVRRGGRPGDWRVAMHISGFKTAQHARQLEWRWQCGPPPRRHRMPATSVPLRRRVKHLKATLALERVTSTAPLARDVPLTVHLHERPDGSLPVPLDDMRPLAIWPRPDAGGPVFLTLDMEEPEGPAPLNKK